MGTGGEAGNQTFRGLEDKVSWVEKFVQVGASGMEAAQDECNRYPSPLHPHWFSLLGVKNYTPKQGCFLPTPPSLPPLIPASPSVAVTSISK